MGFRRTLDQKFRPDKTHSERQVKRGGGFNRARMDSRAENKKRLKN